MVNVRAVDGRSKQRRLDRSPLHGDTRWLPTLSNFSFRVCDRGIKEFIPSLQLGRASAKINLTSTYVAIGWSETPPDMVRIALNVQDRRSVVLPFYFDQNHMDVAMFFPGSQLLQDR